MTIKYIAVTGEEGNEVAEYLVRMGRLQGEITQIRCLLKLLHDDEIATTKKLESLEEKLNDVLSKNTVKEVH